MSILVSLIIFSINKEKQQQTNVTRYFQIHVHVIVIICFFKESKSLGYSKINYEIRAEKYINKIFSQTENRKCDVNLCNQTKTTKYTFIYVLDIHAHI